jgi:hypothetical protein
MFSVHSYRKDRRSYPSYEFFSTFANTHNLLDETITSEDETATSVSVC